MDVDEYHRIARSHDHWWYVATRALLRQLLAPHLDLERDAVLLDAGGGTGASGAWLADHATTVLGDAETVALAHARLHAPRSLPVQLDVAGLPFADATFAATVCVTVLYHRQVDDPAATVRELARVTRPGGVVCLLEPAGRHLTRGHDHVTHGSRRFALDELSGLAQEAGLQVLRATSAYSFLVPPAMVLRRLGRAGGGARSDVERTTLGPAFGALARAERRWLRTHDLSHGLSAVVLAQRP